MKFMFLTGCGFLTARGYWLIMQKYNPPLRPGASGDRRELFNIWSSFAMFFVGALVASFLTILLGY